MDITSILVLLQKVSDSYDINYNELLELCRLTDADLASSSPTTEYEHLYINNINYLYDAQNNKVYSNETTPQLIGVICRHSHELLKF